MLISIIIVLIIVIAVIVIWEEDYDVKKEELLSIGEEYPILYDFIDNYWLNKYTRRKQ